MLTVVNERGSTAGNGAIWLTAKSFGSCCGSILAIASGTLSVAYH
jgi:hypothetical protein